MYNWDEFLGVAKHLVTLPDEGSNRTAIGRAYYYAFHHARLVIMRRKNKPLDTSIGHKQVWNELKKMGGKMLVIGELGDELRTLRVQADYYDSFANKDANALDAIADAQEIVEALVANTE